MEKYEYHDWKIVQITLLKDSLKIELVYNNHKQLLEYENVEIYSIVEDQGNNNVFNILNKDYTKIVSSLVDLYIYSIEQNDNITTITVNCPRSVLTIVFQKIVA